MDALDTIEWAEGELVRLRAAIDAIDESKHQRRTRQPSDVVTSLSEVRCESGCEACAEFRDLAAEASYVGRLLRISETESQLEQRLKRQARSKQARSPRNRTPKLAIRGLMRILEREPSLTPTRLFELLKYEKREFDEHGDEPLSVELGETGIVVTNVDSGEQATVADTNLPTYLSRARNHLGKTRNT